jgi:hypothetical protein
MAKKGETTIRQKDPVSVNYLFILNRKWEYLNRVSKNKKYLKKYMMISKLINLLN